MELPYSIIEKQIKRGTIMHSTMFKNIDHGKFFVIIGVTDSYIAGFFFVNSNINVHLENKPKQFAMQYPMRKKDYAFLHHDSFLCATEIEQISRTELVQTMCDGITTIKGEMKSEHITELLERARESGLFSKIEQKQFLY